MVAVTLVALAVSVLTIAVTFLTAQAALGPHGTSLGAPGSAQAAVGACLYLTLICLLGLGLATLLRSSAIAPWASWCRCCSWTGRAWATCPG